MNARNVMAAPAIVFSDMDGTFLSTNKDVPSPHLSALDLLAQRGIPFVPCTGRPVSGIPQELMAHSATRYAVGSNGAVVYDVRQGRNLHVKSMSKERILALYERVCHVHATFDVFADGRVFSERARYEAMGSYGIDLPTLEVLRRVREPVDLTVPDLVERAQNVEKITCFWRDESDRQALEQAVAEVGGLSSAQGHPKDFELQAQGVSKGFALEWLCGYLGLDAREAMAFGDEANDVAMLRAAGDGVAMENATPEVKRVANHVCDSNDRAGVAQYLFRALGVSHLAQNAS